MTATTAIAPSSLTVARSLAARNLLMLRRVPAVLVPAVIFPVIIVVAFSGAYGAMVRVQGFPVSDMIDWMLPMAIVQGSAFSGVNVGLGVIRDIETGFFDRLIVAPASRLSIVAGPMIGAMGRALIPCTVVLVVGLLAGAHLPGGFLGVVALLVAALGAALIAAGWGVGLALRIRNMRAAPLMQLGLFLTVFLSTAQVPLDVMRGWLRPVARLNPMTNVLALARQGFIGQANWSDTWPGLVAIALAGSLMTLFAVRGLRRLTP